MLFLAPPASAVTGCAFAAGTVTVTIDSPATAIIGVNVVAGDDEIVFDNDNTLAGSEPVRHGDRGQYEPDRREW